MHCQKNKVIIKTWGQHDNFCNKIMKTLDLFNELKSNGVNANMSTTFSYKINPNKSYYCITIDAVPTKEIISIADSYNMMWVAQTYVDTQNGIHYSVKFEAMPKDMKSFDFK